MTGWRHAATLALVACLSWPACSSPEASQGPTAAYEDGGDTGDGQIAGHDASPAVDDATAATWTDAAAHDASADVALAPGPPYPVVLAHGFFGFEAFAGLSFATYFHEVRADLAASGEAEVFTPSVDPFNSSKVRGGQLIAHVEAILAQTGRARVVLIGHSQGGLDARVVAHQRPDLVAAVVTYATPNHGCIRTLTPLLLSPPPSPPPALAIGHGY